MARNEDGTVPAIYGSIAEVMKGLANVPKNGKMKFGQTSYDYLKADDVQIQLNPLLTENNIVVQSQYGTRDVTKGSREWVYVDLRLTYISAIDGSEMAVNATGESIAGDDKSVNKALTQAIKNCHRAMFQFASGEIEPDDLAPAQEGAKAKATPSALTKARKDQSNNKPTKGTEGESRDLIRKEFVDTKKKTVDEIKALVEEIKKEDKPETQEELYSKVLRRLRAEAGTGK